MASDKELYDQYLYDQYLKETGKTSATEKLNVVEETHPDITFMDRFNIKNFGVDQEQSANYLRDKFPGHDVRVHNNRIIMKAPNEKEFRPLDPKGFDWQDITDVGYDVGAGIVEGVATAAGGVAGLALSPAGALAGGAAAGAATGASLEAMRQSFGKHLGIAEEYDPTSMGAAAITGAVSPLLLGTGAGAKQVAKQALKKGMTKEVAMAAQRGALGRGYDFAARKAAPKIAELTSGVEAGAYKEFVKNPKTMQAIEEAGPDVIADELAEKIIKSESNAYNQIGKEFQEKVRESGQVIDLKNVKDKVRKNMEHFENIKDQRGYLDPEDQMKYDTLEALYNRAFKRDLGEKEVLGIAADGVSLEKKTVRDIIDIDHAEADEIMNIQQILSDAGAIYKDDAKKIAAQKYLDGLQKDFSGEIKKSLEKAIPERKGLAERFHRAIKDQNFLNKTLLQKNMEGEAGQYGSKMLGFLYNKKSYSKAPAYRRLKELAKKHGYDVDKTANQLQAHKYLYDASLHPLSGGATSTSRTVSTAIVGGAAGQYLASEAGAGYGGGKLGMAAGAALGAMAGSPAAMKRLLKMGYTADQAARKLQESAISAAKQKSQILGRAAELGLSPQGKKQMAAQSYWNLMESRDAKRNRGR